MSAAHAAFHPLVISDIAPLTDDSVTITFAVPDDLREDYAFTAGQHLTVRTKLAGDDVRRSYSICSPVSSGVLRIGVKRLAGGAFSEVALSQLHVGDSVEVMTPSGRFGVALDPTTAKHHVCIAAGSGITPMLSIIATTLEGEPRSRVTLVYGNRTSKSVMFLEELEDLKDRYPERLHLVHVLSREPQEVELFSGRLDADRVRRILGVLAPVETVDEFFLCGPFGMVTAVRTLLVDAGVPRRQIHAEVFHIESATSAGSTATAGTTSATGSERGAGRAGTDQGASVTITLDGRRSSFRLPEVGPPVLEAALAVRPDAPFACRGGVCGTCRAKVVDGTVRMDTNWALEPEEIERGYVLTCQSHPTSATLVLDYDA